VAFKIIRTQWLFHGLFFTGGLLVAASFHVSFAHPARQELAVTSTRSNSPVAKPAQAHNTPKPWGNLESLKIPLADSEEFFLDRQERLRPARWFFEGLSEHQLAELFDSCGLTPQQSIELTKSVSQQSNGCFVLPTTNVIRSLSSSARQQIYQVLKNSSTNYAQCYPFRFPRNDFASKFADTGLSAQTLELLRSLTYTNSRTLCLADLQILPELLTPAEFNQVIDAIYRWPSYFLHLRVYPDSDVEPLVRYWGAGGMERRIRPLLESLAKIPNTNGTSINITALLPSFARARLNTFPDSWAEEQVSREDCFWTSLNFFNEQPDMRFLDSSYVKKVLQAEYVTIGDKPRYGDLATLVNKSGDGLHICVYIAEDFVFTKNGMNELSPWMLMKISDMMLAFPSEQPQRLVFLRRKA
jgi:hypothetical protein